jgi:hypothetical protein
MQQIINLLIVVLEERKEIKLLSVALPTFPLHFSFSQVVCSEIRDAAATPFIDAHSISFCIWLVKGVSAPAHSASKKRLNISLAVEIQPNHYFI